MISSTSHPTRRGTQQNPHVNVIGTHYNPTTGSRGFGPTSKISPTVAFINGYPTPPSSPDLDIEPVLLSPETPSDDSESDPDLGTDTDPSSADTSLASTDFTDIDDVATAPPSPPAPSVVIPIPFLLNTSYSSPHASPFHFTQPTSLLSALGGNRVVSLDSSQTIWDRMPYTAAAAAAHAKIPTEEDAVEALVGGERDTKPNGLHWTMRSQKSNDTSTIFVHPPTPERDVPPPTASLAPETQEALKSAASQSRTPSPRESPTGTPITFSKALPITNHPLPPQSGSIKQVPVPIQVLPEVRSPPRRTISMAADSLQINQRRGRRPRLFGFTGLPESPGSSASSSANNSRQTSPERSASPATTPTALPARSAYGPATSAPNNFIPRRQPIRARSENNLQTISSLSITTGSSSTSPSTTPTTSSQLSLTHPPPRRRENGLKLDFTGIIPVPSALESQSSIVPSPYSARLIRKKSGEILKPALKYGGPLGPNGTPLQGPKTDLDTSPHPRFESKSCPTTPSCPKYVHFDTQLERVKLFLHDQKPQVVSRGGSPTAEYTTSEGEEYPFPSTDEERDDKRVLTIKLPNFPTSHAPETDLYLESLFLDDDRKSLRGMIMCKNLSFQKWVAVRFTLDFWQTTSEVTAIHKDSVKGGKYDRFSFVVKLHDILSRIEEKTMFLAIRYNTDGREIWDSNGGQNYQVLFEKARMAVTEPTIPKRNSVSIQPGMGKAVGGRTSQWSLTGGNADDRLADLRAKLSRLTADDMSTSPPQLSPNRERTFGLSPSRRGPGIKASSPSGSPARSFSSLDQPRTSDLPSAGGALAARYDFGTALKTTRRASPNSQRIELPEVQTGLLQYGTRNGGGAGGRVNHGHAATEFYSPRYSPQTLPEAPLHSHDYLFSPPTDSPQTIETSKAPSPLAVPGLVVQGPSPPLVGPTAPHAHTHNELDVLTPTTTRPSLTRSITSPAVIPSPRESPPSLDTPTGSLTDTPTDSPKSPADESLPRWSPTSPSGGKGEDMSNASYSSFIEQFCWGGVAQSPPDPRRTHSSSSLDAYFSEARETARSPSALSPGSTTPRPSSYSGMGAHGLGVSGGPGTPSSTSSYYTSFTSTPTNRDIEAVEDGLRSLESSPGGRFSGMGLGRMSPVAC